jgi:hypothetical protein
MKTDVNGCSTVRPGQEQFENFYSHVFKARRIQYDYRTPDGKLFSCIGKTLDECRAKRNAWLKEQEAK